MSQPKLIVVETLPAINDLVEYLANKDLVTYDCETTGLTNQDHVIGFSVCAAEDVAHYVVLQKWVPELGKLIPIPGMFEQSVVLLKQLQGKQLVMHNAVFDCRMAEAYFKVNLIDSLHTDTMVLAHLLDENRRVGLKELAATMFGEDSTAEQAEMKASVIANGGKLTKTSYEMYKADSNLMGRYGAKDALLTYKLFMELVPELIDQGLDKFFYEDESMPLLRGPTFELNCTGLLVDTKRLTLLKKQLEAECAEAKSFIYQEINVRIKDKYPGTTKKNTFNIGAPVQLSWLLFDIYELEFSTLTSGGKEACKALGLKLPYTATAKRDFIGQCKRRFAEIYEQEAVVNGKKKRAKRFKEPWGYIMADKRVLAKYAPRYKWIDRLLEYQRKTKLLTTYIKGIETRINYGIIRPSFLQHGTTSGRYASRDPNWQNLPRDDKRIKECIIARPGKVFVGADYSQLEPRVFSYLSQDANLMSAFNGTNDFYSVIGMKVYGKNDCTPKKEGSPDAFGIKYKKLRDLSKVIALASVYGATARQLMQTTGKSEDDTQSDMDAYFEEFPGVAKFMLDSHALAKKLGYVTNLFGRLRRMPEAKRIERVFGTTSHNELPYDIRSILNLATNHRVQSTSASIVNRAAIAFCNKCKELGFKAKLVAQMHDELVVECEASQADEISTLLQYCMEETTLLPGVPLEAIPRITETFAK